MDKALEDTVLITKKKVQKALEEIDKKSHDEDSSEELSVLEKLVKKVTTRSSAYLFSSIQIGISPHTGIS